MRSRPGAVGRSRRLTSGGQHSKPHAVDIEARRIHADISAALLRLDGLAAEAHRARDKGMSFVSEEGGQPGRAALDRADARFPVGAEPLAPPRRDHRPPRPTPEAAARGLAEQRLAPIWLEEQRVRLVRRIVFVIVFLSFVVDIAALTGAGPFGHGRSLLPSPRGWIEARRMSDETRCECGAMAVKPVTETSRVPFVGAQDRWHCATECTRRFTLEELRLAHPPVRAYQCPRKPPRPGRSCRRSAVVVSGPRA